MSELMTPLPRLLRFRASPAVDTEPPYEREDSTLDSAPLVIGALALAIVPAPPATDSRPALPVRRQLELVPRRIETAPDFAGDEFFDVVKTARSHLPAPGPRAGVLVRAIMEALSGRRPLTQLIRWVTTDVYDELEVNVAPDRGRGWAGPLRRLIVSEPADGVAEVTAVVQRGQRATALALRLEGRDGRWVVTALQMA